MINIKVPARICFFGDHQDYLGLPVIAGTINRFIELRASPISEKAFKFNLKDLGASKTIAFDDSLTELQHGDYLRSGFSVLKNKGFVYNKGFYIEISGNIPLNAGLSSSSALVVLWIRFLIKVAENSRPIDDKTIGHWAYEAEVEYFDSPGGLMDQYTIAQQGLLYIDTKTGKTERLKGALGNLVVAESGVSKETWDVLKNGRVFQEKAIAAVREKNPEFDIQKATLADYEKYSKLIPEALQDHWYAAIVNYDITKKAKTLLDSSHRNMEELGQLMNAHQLILQERIQNTPVQMAKMMKTACEAGALGAKTIGSGGGGCMVAMVNKEKEEQVVEAFLEADAKVAYGVELIYPSS